MGWVRVCWLGWLGSWAWTGAASAEVPRAERTSAPSPGDDAERWRASLDRVTRSVVTIRVDRSRAFEGGGRANAQATGFVVDAERGLILTNRHVVTAGPVSAQAVFLDNEVADLVPVYRDPIHDFGLFRYDPAKVRFMKPAELPLRPDLAAVGVEIRVVGNDSGERLSILDGTLARIDRPAPEYGGSYSDLDTFYLQAGSSTSGGSSGSPVVNVDGDVLALNAGAKNNAATAFYLPLDRVVTALALIQAGSAVPRGTLQTRMVYTPFDELGRLGLSAASEAEARAARPSGTGMLVVRDVVPEGPAADALKPGDVVIAIDDRPLFDFVTLEAYLDDHVGQTVTLTVERGGERARADAKVGDLWAIVPSRLLELGGGVVHDLSFHQARPAGVPIRGVYVADAGRSLGAAGVSAGSVIVQADGAPVNDLDDLVAAVERHADGDLLRVRAYGLSRPQQVGESAVRLDRRWFPVRLCARDDAGGWPCRDLPGPETLDGASERPRPAALDVAWPPTSDRRAETLAPSLVGVSVDVPYPVAGTSGTTYTGGGLVVDAERGLVVVDRDTVPIALADIRITVAGSFEVPARLVALHETHNLALIAYDPADLGSLAVRSARFAPRALRAGDRAWFVGLERDASIHAEPVEVDGIDPFSLPANGAPRFRERNLDVVELRDAPPSTNGVLTDRAGRVAAFWASFAWNDGEKLRESWRAIPDDLVREVLALADVDPADRDAPRTLGWELGSVPIPRALDRGLPPAEAERLVDHDPDRRSVLQVVRIARGDALGEVLRTGDLLLAIDGAPVSRYRDVDLGLRGNDAVEVTVCRDGGLVTVTANPRPLVPIDVDRVVLWAGASLHAPDRSAQLEGVEPVLPYIAMVQSGSPATRASLYAQRSVTAVDGQPVRDLDGFVAALGRSSGRSVRLELRTRTGEREVVTVQPDLDAFPTQELARVDGGWVRRAIPGPAN